MTLMALQLMTTMKIEQIECLIDDEAASDVMARAEETLRAAEASGDEALAIDVRAYRMAERLWHLAKARRHELTVRCLDETPDGEQARADVWHAEQLMAHHMDYILMVLDSADLWMGSSALSVVREDDAGAAPGGEVGSASAEDLLPVVVGEDDRRVLAILFKPGIGGADDEVGALGVAVDEPEGVVHDRREDGRRIDRLASGKRVRVVLPHGADVIVEADEVATIYRQDRPSALELRSGGRLVARIEEWTGWGQADAVSEL